jgi:hypothetical protein
MTSTVVSHTVLSKADQNSIITNTKAAAELAGKAADAAGIHGTPQTQVMANTIANVVSQAFMPPVTNVARQ